MSFRNEIEQYLEQIQILEESFRQMRDMEMLPLSFFSSSYDILKQLTSGLHNIESLQIQMMEKHLKEMESLLIEPEVKKEQKTEPGEQPVVVKEQPAIPQEPAVVQKITTIKEPEPGGFLGDRIGKKLFADFKQSLSLNDRFRFQRDLFEGNAEAMNSALDQLNKCNSLDEATAFLDHLFNWNWEQDSAVAFKDLLEKRFA